MNKKEIAEYFLWFTGCIPQRLRELEGVVTQTPQFQEWRADLTPESLDLLGEWFAAQVEIRPRSENEIQEIRSRISIPIEISGGELTNRTFSLAVDVGMYLSQVFLNNHSALKWAQPFGSKRDVDYGQPVLAGFGRVFLNPVRILIVLAYGVKSKTKSGKRLREIYEIWRGKICI